MTHSSYEDDDEEWQDEEDDDGYIPCPYCGETMLEAADHCPYCDRWITSEQTPSARRPWWIVAVVLVLLAMIAMSTFRL